jgi:hypothetical protein
MAARRRQSLMLPIAVRLDYLTPHRRHVGAVAPARTEEHRDAREQVKLRTVSELCHIPPKPWANTASYRETGANIVVAGNR